MREVQKIACANNAAFVMWFDARTKGAASVPTGNYPINQVRIIDLATTPLREGLEFWPEVHAVLGKTQAATDHVIFKKNGQTATYEVTGTTWSYAIDLIGKGSERTPPAGFPAEVPLNSLSYGNWSRTINASEVWVCAPRTTADVVAVCNWARDSGYHVRPRGVMHNWSPLTLVQGAADDRMMLIDLTKNLYQMSLLPAAAGMPTRVRVGLGATMDMLLDFLEKQPGGQGSAPGYSFPHTPAPGTLTVGGVLAINGHGTAVPTGPLDSFPASYGSMSNQILELTAVVTDPASPRPDQYALRTFKRGEGDAKAFLTHLGRAFLVDATLHVVDNYNLRCESITRITAKTLFQAPTPTSPVPDESFAHFLEQNGRIEVIWFPFSENPWLHLWTVAPEKPAASRIAAAPYNYPFADNVTSTLEDLLKFTLDKLDPALTPELGRAMATVTSQGLDGKDFFGTPTYPPSRDLWGPSKNTLLYIKDSTLRVTANGYAVQLRKADIQRAVHDFTTKFEEMLARYAAEGKYPVNAPLEIRVTSLDEPQKLGVPAGTVGAPPVISSLNKDEVAIRNHWDVALWIDVLTIPGTANANAFFRELEVWLLQRFSGSAGRPMPEWSKGWAYTGDGPWTDADFLEKIRQFFTAERAADDTWKFEVETLQTYDRANLFSNPFLARLFTAK